MNKSILIVLLLSFGITSCAQSNNGNKSKKQAEMIVKNTEYNFGEIEYAGDGTHEFVFKNTGKAPLIIKHVESSCGCTTPEWSKEMIKPGRKGKIKVKYDTKRIGNFIKSVKVYSNAKNSPVVMVIRGHVNAKTLE